MEKRGGGLRSVSWKSFVAQEPGLFQLFIEFDTRDSMGANFINTVLEQFSASLQDFFKNHLSASFDAYLKTKEEFDKRFRTILDMAVSAPQMWEKLIPGADVMKEILTGKKKDEDEKQ